jgi:hypothetical protein
MNDRFAPEPYRHFYTAPQAAINVILLGALRRG